MDNKKIKIIISGGGTGGHVYPAIAIADQMKKTEPQADILFVGALGRMEMDKVPAAGYEIIGLPVEGLKRSLSLHNFNVLVKFYKALKKSKQILKTFEPDVVVGVGGYASAPLLKAAAKMNIPYIIQEQNSYAGLTNKMLAKNAQVICVAYPDMEKYFPKEKIIISGNPVRNNIVNNSITRHEALMSFDLNPRKKTILSIGGSLGAKTINESILNGLDFLLENNIQVIWQTGKYYYEDIVKKLENKQIKGIKILPFITEMDKAYKAADLVISRSGALSVSELCLTAKPAILVPSPNVAEDHQTKNAMALVKNKAAVLVNDADATTVLLKKAIDLINDDNELNVLSKNIAKLAVPNSAEIIVNEIMKLTKSKV